MVTDLTGNVSWNLLIKPYRMSSCGHSVILYLKEGGDVDSELDSNIESKDVGFDSNRFVRVVLKS